MSSGGEQLQNSLFGESQWQLESMQLVNFGPFDGYHKFEFKVDANELATTVISGESGSGKSTLQDAFFEVMTRNGNYNTASNEGGRGGTLSSEKRSLIGYVRGKLEDVEDDNGNTVARLLRDGSCNRWSAIVLTYRSNNGTVFTAAKLFWIAAGYSTNADIKQLRVTMYEQFDPRVLESIANVNFTAERIGKVIDCGFKSYARVDEFLTYLYSVLKIDESGHGKDVMDLLGRIRSGANFKSIDELFREQVLDVPATYQRAQEAAHSYHKHMDAYEKMLDKQRRIDALADISSLGADLEKMRFDADAHAVAKSDHVFDAWRLNLRAGLLETRIQELDSEAEELQVSLDELGLKLARAATERDGLAAQLVATGFNEHIAALDAEIARAKEQASRVRASRESFEREAKAHFGSAPDSKEDFDKLQESVRTFVQGYDAELETRTAEHTAAVEKRVSADAKIREIRADLDYYGKSKSRVPRKLGEARQALAKAAGLSVSELPFAAELMDVNDESWRLAVESVYGGFARTLLVNADDFEHFSAAIDKLKLRSRVVFRRVKQGLAIEARGKEGYLSEKLDFDESSPFAGWLINTACDDHHDALRVASPEELGAPGRRVTINGQTREGSRGAHGRDANSEGIIGFDNSAKVDTLAAQLVEAAQELQSLQEDENAAQEALSSLKAKRESAQRIMGFSFDEIDLASSGRALEAARISKQNFLDENEEAGKLEERLNEADARVLQLTKRHAVCENNHKTVMDRREHYKEQAEQCKSAGGDAGLQSQTGDNPTLLILHNLARERFGGHSTEDNLNGFDSIVDNIKGTIGEQLVRLEQQAKDLSDRISTKMGKYLENWPDSHLGLNEFSIPDYRALLEKLEAEQFHTQKESWYEHMLEWIKEDLIPLEVAFRDARTEIDDKLAPINGILRTLPFGRDAGRLEIVCRDSIPKDAREFSALLRELVDYERNAEIIDEDAYHRKAETLMKIIDPQNTSAESTRRRNEVLDRRRHVKLTARVIDLNSPDKPKATFNALASKSGGETEEIVAFILGAALLYRLGKDSSSRPGFAPVLLDEGFIKADSRFTSRAIAAWQGFGFQLIIAVPEEKYQSAIARAQRVIHIVIDANRRSHVNHFDLFEKDAPGSEVSGSIGVAGAFNSSGTGQ